MKKLKCTLGNPLLKLPKQKVVICKIVSDPPQTQVRRVVGLCVLLEYLIVQSVSAPSPEFCVRE